MIVNLDGCLDLRLRGGRKQKWRSSTFPDDYQAIQGILEACGAHKALGASR